MNTNKGVRLADRDIEFVLCEIKSRLIKNRMIKYYVSTKDSEVKEVVDHLKHNTINTFPYDYKNNYNLKNVKVGKSKKTQLLYADHNGKKIYMKKKYTSPFRVRRYINNILIEQDEKSPHRYLSDDFMPDEDTVVLDIGGAEGLFSAMIIDRVKKKYIFECDKEWVYALKHTFKNYKDKIEIIERFVDDYTDCNHVTLDDFVKQYGLEREKLFVKIDAEGSEPSIIDGASSIIGNNDIKLAVCTYHCQEHEALIKKRFSGWNISNSPGYMIYYCDFNWDKPYLRRGLLRIKKTEDS